ncbi:helix-turn-helix domain-containing protein [Streptomyces sp. NPDC047097]|uniref:nSTAND1 domain-containing NTPase n=1 Tax=Streptomyces sp. NPDC047097 TaxID=3155260 RepID=UPI0033EAA962
MGEHQQYRARRVPAAPAGASPADFPAELRRLRMRRGLSLSDLARRTHYSKGYLSKIETGAKPVTDEVARSCDDALRAHGRLLRLVPAARVPSDGPPPAPGSGAPEDTGCPYRGLRPFTAGESGWFFGREQATSALVERVFERIGGGPLLLVAPSGAGKSSLLSAGLLPTLRRPGGFPMPGADRWPVVVCTPTARPLEELLERTAKALGTDIGVTVARLREYPAALSQALRRLTDSDLTDSGPTGSGVPGAPDRGQGPHRAATSRERRRPPVHPVLIVDQFEELFTLCPDEAERRAYARVLSALATTATTAAEGSAGADAAEESAAEGGPRPAIVVLGVRADFIGRCLGLPELAPALTDGLFALAPMTGTELREAITRPARLAGLRLEAGLEQLLLRDAGLGTTTPHRTAAPAGALPLLSHALMATWRQREGTMLTVTGYERTGGIQGAVARTAEEAFATLYPDEQRTARRLLPRLAHLTDGEGASRRRVERAALEDRPAAAAVLDRFARARLVTVDRDTVELTHEALLHAWPRLRGWLAADRAGLLIHQQLAQAAAEWEHEDRDPSLLYRGSRLETARTWAADPGATGRLGPVEADFLTAGQLEEDRRLRQARRHTWLRRGLLATLVVLLAVALAAGTAAQRQRSDALHQERTARSRALALESAALAAGRPEASMLLAAAAYRAAGTPEALGALLSTQAQPFSARLTGHRGPVNAIALSPDGSLLATASSDGTVRLWRTTEHRPTAVLPVPGRVRAVAFSADGRLLATTSTRGPVRLWDTARRRTAGVLPATTATRALAFDPLGRTLATAGADGRIRIWPARGGPRPQAVLTGHTGEVNALAYGPDGLHLASAGADHTVRLWDTALGRPRAVLHGHTDTVLGLALAPDGRALASGGADRTVRLWDTADGRTTAVLTGHSDDVNALAYTPDGTTVVSAGGDGTTRLWDVRTGRTTASLAGHTDYVLGVAVDPRGGFLVTAGFDQSAVVWDLSGPTLASRPFTEIRQLAYSPDGTLLATADTDRTVRLWDVARRRGAATLTGHRGAVNAVAFAPDGRTLASAGTDGAVHLWDVPARRPLGTLPASRQALFAVAFAPDGRTLASAGVDRVVRLWDVPGRRPLGELPGHTDFANAAAFSPDGRLLATAGDDLTVRLWDVPSRRALAVLTGHRGAVRSVAFSPDGRTLASSGNDGAVRLWDPAERRALAVLAGHTGSARGVAFSPDGRLLVSGGSDRAVRLWDLAGRTPRAALTGHTGAVWAVAFAPGGHTAASSGSDGSVRLWTLDPATRLTAVCRSLDSLPPAERRALTTLLTVPAPAPCPVP